MWFYLFYIDFYFFYLIDIDKVIFILKPYYFRSKFYIKWFFLYNIKSVLIMRIIFFFKHPIIIYIIMILKTFHVICIKTNYIVPQFDWTISWFCWRMRVRWLAPFLRHFTNLNIRRWKFGSCKIFIVASFIRVIFKTESVTIDPLVFLFFEQDR